MIQVLVAVDLCEHSALTIEVAHAIAKGSRGKVTVVHVVSLPDEPPGGRDPTHEEWVKMRGYALFSAEQALDRLLGRIGLVGEVDRRLVSDRSPPDAISEEARRLSADLIVVGVHERPLLTRWLSGGTGRRVQRRAHCPVISVRSGAPEELAERRKPRRAVMRAEVLE